MNSQLSRLTVTCSRFKSQLELLTGRAYVFACNLGAEKSGKASVRALWQVVACLPLRRKFPRYRQKAQTGAPGKLNKYTPLSSLIFDSSPTLWWSISGSPSLTQPSRLTKTIIAWANHDAWEDVLCLIWLLNSSKCYLYSVRKNRILRVFPKPHRSTRLQPQVCLLTQLWGFPVGCIDGLVSHQVGALWRQRLHHILLFSSWHLHPLCRRCSMFMDWPGLYQASANSRKFFDPPMRPEQQNHFEVEEVYSGSLWEEKPWIWVISFSIFCFPFTL